MIAGQILLYGALQFDAAFVANMSCDLSPTFLDIHDKQCTKTFVSTIFQLMGFAALQCANNVTIILKFVLCLITCLSVVIK